MTLMCQLAGRLPAMRAKVLAAAEASGRAPGDLRCVLNVAVHVGGEVDPLPDLVAGQSDQVAARLHQLAQLASTPSTSCHAAHPPPSRWSGSLPR